MLYASEEASVVSVHVSPSINRRTSQGRDCSYIMDYVDGHMLMNYSRSNTKVKEGIASQLRGVFGELQMLFPSDGDGPWFRSLVPYMRMASV